MPARGPPSPSSQPSVKRQRQESLDAEVSPTDAHPGSAEHSADAASTSGINAVRDADGLAALDGKAGQSSNFRNVSACNRCRMRKNRCDQQLPSCASCAKTGVACVGYDPITKREIPRSYVFYLETRTQELEKLLISNNIPFPPADDLDICSRPGSRPIDVDLSNSLDGAETGIPGSAQAIDLSKKKNPAMLNIVSSAKPRSLASASGVSFARVVLAAVQYSAPDQNGLNDQRPPARHPTSGTSMRDSFFGLHTKPTIQPASFPDREVGIRLVNLYFEHANPQIPILHRGEFMQMFDQAYASENQTRGSRELYMLNMVFAIGSGVIVGEPVKTDASGDHTISMQKARTRSQPEEYHASAIVHLETCLSSSCGGLEVLQAILLLANFALLRPVPPGLWYITGVALRLAVDLGLHYEDGTEIDTKQPDPSDPGEGLAQGASDSAAQQRGRRLWVRDMRRRLWWCTYSFDRLVSTCVGRPFGIGEGVITTDMPSLLDDEFITPSGFLTPPDGDDQPSYKHVSHHYFRLRMLQSEVVHVLQFNQAQIAREGNGSRNPRYPEMHSRLPSPFLMKYESFKTWRLDIDNRLFQWKQESPTQQETGVAFSTEFLELNYWQAVIMLYRQSLSVPAMFEGEYNTSKEVESPTGFTTELREDEDRIYLKVAEAGQKILRIYRQLHLSGLVSYTYLSTHHLFMAGISYLYAIWHSPVVRSRLTMDEVDFTVLAARSVFTEMIDKCPPAETCRDAFDRTAKATIKMASSCGGFGSPKPRPRRQRRETYTWSAAPETQPPPKPYHRKRDSDHQTMQFDVALQESHSSPSLSTGGEMAAQATPPEPLSRPNAFDTDTFMTNLPPRSGPSPAAQTTVSQDGSSIDPAAAPSSVSSRRSGLQTSAIAGQSFIGPQFGLQGGSMDFPDAHTMDFLQNLNAPNGEFGALDQAQLDLGFGLNWESIHNDYGETHQLNPFDNFFFGGQPGGNNGQGGMNNGGSH